MKPLVLSVLTTILFISSECRAQVVVLKVPPLRASEVVVKTISVAKIQSKTARSGNESGGGGNLVTIKHVTHEQLHSYVGKLKAVTKQVFLALRNGQKVLPSGTYKKLYGTKGSDIFTAIDETTIQLSSSSCIDPHTGEERDGSADMRAMSICLSSPRLTSKLYNTSGYELLVKLMTHEAGHLVGLDEVEAHVLEEYVQLPDVQSPDDLDKISDDIAKTSYKISETTDSLRLKNYAPKKELCAGLLDLYAQDSQLSQIAQWQSRNTYLLESKNYEVHLPSPKLIADYCFYEKINQESVISSLKQLCQFVSSKNDGSCY